MSLTGWALNSGMKVRRVLAIGGLLAPSLHLPGRPRSVGKATDAAPDILKRLGIKLGRPRPRPRPWWKFWKPDHPLPFEHKAIMEVEP
jgi:hypothetical protein